LVADLSLYKKMRPVVLPKNVEACSSVNSRGAVEQWRIRPCGNIRRRSFDLGHQSGDQSLLPANLSIEVLPPRERKTDDKNGHYHSGRHRDSLSLVFRCLSSDPVGVKHRAIDAIPHNQLRRIFILIDHQSAQLEFHARFETASSFTAFPCHALQ